MNPAAAEPAPSAAVLIQGLRKQFAGRSVLDGLDLRIEPGESVALLGESGSGKSTLLNLIAGLEPADGGTIAIAGHPISALDADAAARLRSRFIGFAFQAFHLLPQLDAQRNVAVPLLIRGIPAREALPAAAAMLERLGLSARLQARISELSGGEQQRIALARALVGRPTLLLADEPTGNLDPGNAAAALRLIRDQALDSGAALLMVTHSDQAAAIADRRLVLRAGLLHAHAPDAVSLRTAP